MSPPHARGPFTPAAHSPLLAQAQYTIAAVALALAFRKIERLTCDAADITGLNQALCSAKAALDSTLNLNINAALLVLLAIAAVAALARLAVWAFRKAPVYIMDFSVYNPDPRYASGRLTHFAGVHCQLICRTNSPPCCA